jgi:4-hydroxy-tetrahydrodipicolinate synthase
MKQVEVKGIIPAIVTPMNDDESVNIDVLRQQIERQIAGGVHGLFPFGTNGEGYILSEKEKIEVLEATIDQVKGRVPVYAGTGCISTTDTIRMSKKAEELGADILSIITPSFALASQKELYDHYVEVAKHVNIPIVLYNIPARTGNKLLPETVAKLAKDVDVIVGAKDSSGDWDNLLAYITQTRDLDKDFRVLSGNDSLILPCLKEGGAGGITGCANVYPHVLSSIYDLFIEGKLEEAQAAQDSIANLRAVFKYGNPNTIVKTAVALLGYNVGKCRAPFNQVPEVGVEALKQVLAENTA